MKAIPERLKEALAREFTEEQIEEGFKRFEWIIRVRDRGEDINYKGQDIAKTSLLRFPLSTRNDRQILPGIEVL